MAALDVGFNIFEPQHVISISFACVDSNEPLKIPFKFGSSKSCLVSSLTVIEYSSD